MVPIGATQVEMVNVTSTIGKRPNDQPTVYCLTVPIRTTNNAGEGRQSLPGSFSRVIGLADKSELRGIPMTGNG